ncbi:hypothetical protein [Herbaspirillum autotrophicum]|uniref:hypothetical protein n=1 Tax=Herbaspirillum autotrophicum TaxID=180195 RepID=UPI000A688FC2|nr:hypothetical protein [Herbaspirillum autotrophicum]
MKNDACHCFSDAKAFKGKGEFRQALSVAEAFLFQIHEEMALLSAQSRQIRNRPFYLELHKPVTTTAYRVWKLRWRLGGARNGHTNWEHLAPQLDRMAIGERDWYVQFNVRMLELNVIELVTRTRCRWFRSHLLQLGEMVSDSTPASRELNKVQRR